LGIPRREVNFAGLCLFVALTSSGCLSYFVFCQSVKSGDDFAAGLKRFDKASIVSLSVA